MTTREIDGQSSEREAEARERVEVPPSSLPASATRSGRRPWKRTPGFDTALDVALGLLAVAAIGVADWATGDAISLAFLHLFPILLVAYRRRTGPALWVLGAALVACVLVDALTGVTARLGPFVIAFRTFDRAVAYGLTLGLVGLLRRERDHARALAATDPLTGLPNRRSLEATLQREARRAERTGNALALAALDLDGFKDVNDSLGHEAGDRVLLAVAAVLRATRGGDFACRLGGDEFLLLLSSGAASEARAGLDRVLAELRSAMARARVDVTFSVGLAIFEGRMPPPPIMLSRADALMYRIKHGTKNGVSEERYPSEGW
jgi:diguanylate cyclase (GGDEF)-like protein